MKRTALKIAAPVLALSLLAGCANQANNEGGDNNNGGGENNSAAINVTGSATVEPITRYIADRYEHDVKVEAIGSTDGFEKFCAGDADINDASVAIPGEGAPVNFQQQCSDNGVEYIELPIGLDAITIVKNDQNDWATDLTLEDLKKIWSAESEVSKWSDINPEWPDEEIKLFGREEGSGTRGVFIDSVLEGEEIREDVEETDDIQELSKWVSEDKNALSFMGIGNYLSTEGDVRDKIDNVTIDGIEPSRENAQDGTYPLSRPLFIYVSTKAADRDEVNKFVEDYLDNVKAVLPRVFFYQLADEEYDKSKARYTDRQTGPDERWAE